MGSKDFLLKRYLPRIDFDSYEDFKQNYTVNVPDDFNFAYDIVDAWADAFPEKEALCWTNDSGLNKTLTFTDLKKLSNRAANVFLSLGIKKGDCVMLILKQRIEVWVSILALHKIGAIVIPATFQLTPKDIVYRCNSAKVKAICAVDDEEILSHIAAARPTCETLAHVLVVGDKVPSDCQNLRLLMKGASEELPRIQNSVHDPMLLYFSSGTTGMPKMVLHHYDYPLGHIITAKYWHRVEDGGKHLTVSDSGWAKFAWGKIYGQWICGAVIVAYDNEKFVPHNLLAVINRLRLTTFCAPPTIYRFLIKEDMSGCDFSSIHHCTIAGEPLNSEVYNRFHELTGLYVTEGFGQTETPVIVANFPWFPVKPGSMGKPSPTFDVDIVDENGNTCEDGVVGNLVIRNVDKHHPTGLFYMYANDEEAMAKAFRNGWYDTGDTTWRDAEGYLWFEGRSDDIIKCSGYRIGPFEVESALMTHPSVLECAVTAAPDPIRGQVVKATIVLARGFTPSDDLKKELQEHVKHTTAPYKYPRIVEFVTQLPKTTSGKISRKELRKQDERKS